MKKNGFVFELAIMVRAARIGTRCAEELGMRKTPVRRWHCTFLETSGNFFSIELTVKSWFPPKFRRALAIPFFKSIRPWIDYMKHFRVAHIDDWPRNMPVEEQRGIKDDESVDFSNPLYRLGFQLRIARLMHEYSIRQVSLASGVPATHISRIERGLVKARKVTLERLFSALKADIPLPIYKPRTKRKRQKKWASQSVRDYTDL